MTYLIPVTFINSDDFYITTEIYQVETEDETQIYPKLKELIIQKENENHDELYIPAIWLESSELGEPEDAYGFRKDEEGYQIGPIYSISLR